MPASKTTRDPSKYEFKEPTSGYLRGGHKELKAAHDQVDMLETTVEDLPKKLKDTRDESELNEELLTDMSKLEVDKARLQKLVDTDARSKDFQAQLDKERMSTLRVAELEGQLVRIREDHQTALAKLQSEHALNIAHAKKKLEDLDKAHKASIAQLVNDHKMLKLEYQLEISELKRLQQHEIMEVEDKQSSHMHFQGTYRPQAGQEPANPTSRLGINAGRITEES
ncbi:hypothetical protein Q9189_008066 [Teloschistes chrysophthalmus]